MLTRVYVWKPTVYFKKGSSVSSADVPFLNGFGLNLSCGHASVELLQEDGPTMYASYWPPQMVAGKCVCSYAEDVETMEREATSTILIQDLDHSTMEEAWSRELAKDFHNLQHNCCTVAGALLEAGHAAHMFSGVGAFFRKAAGSMWVGVTSPIVTLQACAANYQGLLVHDPDTIEKIAAHLKEING